MHLILLVAIFSQAALADSFFYAHTTVAEDQARRCEWKLFDPATKSDRVLKTFSNACPDHLFLDSGSGTFYYLEDQKLVAADRKNLGKTQSWALPPEAKPPEGSYLASARIWRDKGTNRIRLAFFDSNESRVKTKQRPDETYSVTYKGKSIGTTIALGIVGAAVAFEHDGASWKLVEVRATNEGACDTTGLGGLKIEPSATTLSPIVDKSDLFLCTGDAQCAAKKAPAEIRKPIAARFKDAGVYLLTTVDGWALVSPEAAESEYSNPGFPAMLYSPREKKLVPVAGTPNTGIYGLTVSRDRNWFSLQSDLNEQKTRIYRYDNPKPLKVIDGEVEHAMWVENAVTKN